jgi:UDP-N-acetylglucosamine 2-epimerase (non-hydrolysing)
MGRESIHSSDMISLILGTRPEIIKFSPIIRICESRKIPFFTLHTGQHYSYAMDRIFFEELGLPQPEFNIDAGSGLHGEQTGKILAGVEKVLIDEKPDVVLVQGDTNTVLAGSLAAAKLHIPVGHVEAGLRSFDRSMPEEINRVVADHISAFLFAPTETARRYLVDEGIPDEKITITGNTVVDAVLQNLDIARRKEIPAELREMTTRKFLLVTAHRAENVDSRERLKGILEGLSMLHRELDMPVVYPVHPRTEKMMKQFGLNAPGVTLMKPLGYLEFLKLESEATLILTDSGGLQEESCILGVPCVTLRDNTERPETIQVGSNVLAGTNPSSIVKNALEMIDRTTSWKNPYGDGHAGEYIVKILEEAMLTR